MSEPEQLTRTVTYSEADHLKAPPEIYSRVDEWLVALHASEWPRRAPNPGHYVASIRWAGEGYDIEVVEPSDGEPAWVWRSDCPIAPPLEAMRWVMENRP